MPDYFECIHNYMINRNMGCIEIKANERNSNFDWKINRNMGCIEICFLVLPEIVRPQINRNMGCIEIIDPARKNTDHPR